MTSTRILATREPIRIRGGDSLVIEGSANLRSSDNLEQMLIVNDVETLNFHSAWIDALAA